MYHDCWECLTEAQKADIFFKQLHAKKVAEYAARARNLLKNSHTHHANIHDVDTAKRSLNALVQIDRLPKSNSLEGLQLLQEAWCECDIADYLANRYKLVTKMLYLLQLSVAFLVILASQVQFKILELESATDIVFLLAVLHGGAVSIDGVLRPKPRWHSLRKASSSLESLIWFCRARVGEFRMAPDLNPRSPELTLCKRLNEWTEDLMSSADLVRSSWSRSYPPSIDRHLQRTGDFKSAQRRGEEVQTVAFIDDHYSPVQPELYLQFRLLKRMAWYQKRIPKYACHAFIFKVLVLTCTICAAVLARFGEADAVVLITAFSSAATTWSEFVDAGSKVERYTRAVRTMSQLVNWWKHLSEVEKASTENISELVVQTEQAISKEQTNWLPSQAMGRADNHASASEVSRSNDPKNAERVKLSETTG